MVDDINERLVSIVMSGYWAHISKYFLFKPQNILAISFSAEEGKAKGLKLIIKNFFFLILSPVSPCYQSPDDGGGCGEDWSAAGSKCSDLD